MSIASEITRLQGVKTDILQAIADKGVTVPDGSALDDCPELIELIPTGGGGGGQNFSVFLLNFFMNTQGSVITLELDEFLKSENTISFSVIRKSGAENDLLAFRNSGNQILSRLSFDGSYARYDNAGTSQSYTFSLEQDEVYTFFIYRDKLRFYSTSYGILGNDSPVTYTSTINVIKKVSINTLTCRAGKIEVFKGNAIDAPTDKIMSFVPFNDRANRESGYINVMNGVKQVFTNSYAF